MASQIQTFCPDFGRCGGFPGIQISERLSIFKIVLPAVATNIPVQWNQLAAFWQLPLDPDPLTAASSLGIAAWQWPRSEAKDRTRSRGDKRAGSDCRILPTWIPDPKLEKMIIWGFTLNSHYS